MKVRTAGVGHTPQVIVIGITAGNVSTKMRGTAGDGGECIDRPGSIALISELCDVLLNGEIWRLATVGFFLHLTTYG